jgi:glycosyltransferase involved in cell wall biosynthesis
MRILMISPHPTYTPRGTPISVLNRCRALCALGHRVDLVTYGIGEDVPIAGLRWLRAPVPGIRTVKVGPSLRKLPLDAAVFVTAITRAIANRSDYDVIHSHEEAGIVGAILARMLRLPHVYDMGNDLSVVMRNYGFAARNPLTLFAVAVEALTIRWSSSVVAHFPAIAERVRAVSARIPVTVVENVPIEAPGDLVETAHLRRQWSPDGRAIALYTGTFEAYQGLHSLLEAMTLLAPEDLNLRLVVVGGTPAQQHDLRQIVIDHGIDQSVSVVGAVPMEQIKSCLQAADILVSPRAFGSNTPLKLFSYLHAGKPLLATSITGHLQVLDDECATLVDPTAAGLAGGLRTILQQPRVVERKADLAKRIATERYGIDSYLSAVATSYRPVGGAQPSQVELDCARAELETELAKVAA